MLKINEHEHCSNFFDMLTSFSLFPQITFPTRFSDRKGTLIDNFFCTLTKHTLDSTVGILIKKFSDHQPYFLILDTALKKEQSSKFVHINIQNEAAMLKVKHYFTSCEICKKLDVSPNADTNINYNIILDEIDRAKNKFMPSKMVKLKKYKHKQSSWITKGLLKSIRYRDKLYKQLKLTNPDTFEYSV